jgi:transposase
MILALQDEIRRSSDARYDHRLHAVLLIAQGLSAPNAARLLGDSPRTVEYWVERFERDGLGGLIDGDREGRPSRLSQDQLDEIGRVLRSPPASVGLTGHLWDGKTLSRYITVKFHINLGVRQCQRLFRTLDFRLRKPRPFIAKADPKVQSRHKKTPADNA